MELRWVCLVLVSTPLHIVNHCCGFRCERWYINVSESESEHKPELTGFSEGKKR